MRRKDFTLHQRKKCIWKRRSRTLLLKRLHRPEHFDPWAKQNWPKVYLPIRFINVYSDCPVNFFQTYFFDFFRDRQRFLVRSSDLHRAEHLSHFRLHLKRSQSLSFNNTKVLSLNSHKNLDLTFSMTLELTHFKAVLRLVSKPQAGVVVLRISVRSTPHRCHSINNNNNNLHNMRNSSLHSQWTDKTRSLQLTVLNPFLFFQT